jgi:hypothetical protein
LSIEGSCSYPSISALAGIFGGFLTILEPYLGVAEGLDRAKLSISSFSRYPLVVLHFGAWQT